MCGVLHIEVLGMCYLREAYWFNFREVGAVGSLMACKGLVELIALNIGLEAGILNTRVFSMFVLHALVTTFVTTPLVLLFYPEKYRVHANAVRNSAGITAPAEDGMVHGREGHLTEGLKTRFTLVLDRLEQLPAAMMLAQLLHNPSADSLTSNHPESMSDMNKPEVHSPVVAGTTGGPRIPLMHFGSLS